MRADGPGAPAAAPPRQVRPTDALAIARITARDTDLPPARQPGPATDLKVLSDYRDQLLVLRNAEANRLLADLPAVRAQVARRRGLLRGLASSTTTVRIPVPLAMTLLHRPT